jgi:tetratricopeptide (TPR) repeat protein/tRNA A-37 threonylcarbamoyl transferase component Bud32
VTEREIFFEALGMATPEARAAYLQGVCGGDVTLRRNVDELLKEHFSNDSLLAGSALEAERRGIAEFRVEEAPAQTIGRYKLLEKLGEGGFGEVWMAEQREPVKRRIALKILKLGMDSRQIVARFEAERQALAMMDHANIARIFDAGVTDTGRPYFVMELVRGTRITEYCDQNQLPTRERLKLFILVCQAIQHAHQKGIIHRDIKPTNILVTLHDGVPVPKVIDFGIAKATQQELTDKTLFTQFQQFIGTPAYISPEQAEMSGLDIDTRADIYSLGVLLYELLVGETPFDAKEMMQGGLDALRRIIREKEPLRPSTKLNTLPGEARTTAGKRRQTDVGKLVHQLQGDLDWIVMKCLEKDRTRRYETANGLAADIQRHLANESVVACPPSAGYRLRKFVLRNKGPVLAAGFVLLTLVVGIIGTTLGLIEADRQRDLVDEQRKELAERNRALQAVHEHERLLNERARQAIETVASETAIEHLTREKELRPDQREFLDKMIQYYNESTQDGGVGEEERRRQAQAYQRMGRMNQILGRSQDSEKAYRRAVALGQQLVADFPNQPEFRLELALSHNALGVLLLRANRRPREAESAYVEAMTILRQLAADFPTRYEFRQALAGIQNNLGNLLFETGRPTEAESVQAEALAIRKQLAADFPTDPILRRALAMSHYNLGGVLHSTGRLEEAEAAYRDALVLQKQIVPHFPNRPEFRLELADSHNNLGNVLRDTGRPKEAEAAHAEALAIYKQLVADFPNRPEFRRAWADAEQQEARPATKVRGLQDAGRGTGDQAEEKPTSGDLGNLDFPKK